MITRKQAALSKPDSNNPNNSARTPNEVNEVSDCTLLDDHNKGGHSSNQNNQLTVQEYMKEDYKVSLESIAKPSRNPYTNFVQAFINEIKKAPDFKSGKTMIKLCSVKWNSLTDRQKNPFRTMAKNAPYKKRTYKKHALKRRYSRSSTESTYPTDANTESSYYSDSKGYSSTSYQSTSV